MSYIVWNDEFLHAPTTFDELMWDDEDGSSTEWDTPDDVIHNTHSNNKITLRQTKLQAWNVNSRLANRQKEAY